MQHTSKTALQQRTVNSNLWKHAILFVGARPTLVVKTKNCLYIYVCLVRAYSVYIHPAPFLRDAIFPHCMLVRVIAHETRLARRLSSGLENSEERMSDSRAEMKWCVVCSHVVPRPLNSAAHPCTFYIGAVPSWCSKYGID